MTPTLVGRWQTRLGMLSTLGVLVSLIFAIAFNDLVFFVVLFWVFAFGLLWDIVFILLQNLRWDRDWPAVFQIGAGLLEGAALYAGITLLGLPGIDRGSIPPTTFIAHYGLVWLATFAWVQGPMRTLFPFWRFHGGRMLPVVVPTPNVAHHRRSLRRTRRRPTRVTLAALFLLASGIWGLTYAILLIFVPETIIPVVNGSESPALNTALSAISLPIGVLAFLLSVLYVTLGGGLMGGRGWARLTAIIISAVVVVASVLGLAFTAVAPQMMDLGGMGALGTAATLVIYGAIAISLSSSGRFFH